MKHLFICGVLLATLCGAFLGCDSTTSPNNPLADTPSITGFKINPTSVEFSKDTDGFTDTTLTVYMTVQAKNIDDAVTPQFSIVDENTAELFAEGPFQFNPQNNEYTAEFNVSTYTTNFSTYHVYAFINNEEGKGNSAQSTLTISGFANNPPEIISVQNPSEIQIPSSGKTPVQFKAKVTDSDGQNTIQGVYMRLISRSTGEVSGSPFPLYDDGQINGKSGDQTAQDSVFTLTLEIASSNNPDFYDLEYYAVDKGDLVSDTLKSTLRIKD